MKKDEFSLQDETNAMKAIAEVFEKLPEESRQRIVNWLLSIVGNVAPSAHQQTASEKKLSVSPTNIMGSVCPKGEDIKEFFKSKQPKSNYEKLAVLGYFLEFMKGKDEFNSQDLKIAWKQTREALPSNQVFINSVNVTLSKYKYFVSGEEKGLYRISNKGQQLVETLSTEG